MEKNNFSNLLLIILLIVVIIVFPCPKNKLLASNAEINNLRTADTGQCSQGEYKTYRYSINILDYNELPYNNGATSLKKQKYYDDNSIPLHIYHGKMNYHPCLLVQTGLHLLDVYVTSKDKKYLEKAKKISDKLIGISLYINSSIFFPYTFDFPLHGYKEDTMYSPWYSGMAQGQTLSFFIRLYEMTKEKYYLQVSKKIFNSFKMSKLGNGTPWITCVDQNAFLWIEEYPDDPPAHTLNGMIFAIYGLYDFFRITNDSDSEKLLRGAIKTVKFNINKFRTPNGVSHYCLKHPKIRSIRYHKVHIKQLKMLYKITGDRLFLKASQAFSNDTKNINKRK